MPEPHHPEREDLAEPIREIQEKAQQTAAAETTTTPVRKYRTLVFQGFTLAALAAFALLAYLASTSAYFSIDLTVTQSLQTIRSPAMLGLMRVVSWFGFPPNGPLVVVGTGFLLAFAGLRWEGLVAILSGLAPAALNVLIKIVIQRPRPAQDLVEVFQVLDSYSFPSGHVMFYTGFFGFLAFLSFSLLKRSWLRKLLVAIFTALVVLAGPSRVYLGEHWASDVAGAYLLGVIILMATILFYHWGKARFFKHQPVAPEE